MWVRDDFLHGISKTIKKWSEERAGAKVEQEKWEEKTLPNWDKVNVVKNPTAAEKLWQWIANVWLQVADWYARATNKQTIDNELFWLKKWDTAVSDSGKKDYVQKLYDYDQLRKKENRTAQDLATMADLANDLSQYTVPERSRWIRSTILNTISHDDWRNDYFLKNNDLNRIWVDNERILRNIYASDNAKNQFWIQDEWDTWVRTLTEDEYKKEVMANSFDSAVEKNFKKNVKTWVKNWYIANGNPGWRKSTESEVGADYDDALNQRSIATNKESAREFYSKYKDKYPLIAKSVLAWYIGQMDMISYMLQSNKTDDQARAEFVEKYWDPLVVNFLNLPQDRLNEDEKNLITKYAAWHLAANPMFNELDWDDFSHAINELIRLEEISESAKWVSDGDWLWEKALNAGATAWHSIEYWEALLDNYVSKLWWMLRATGEVIWDTFNWNLDDLNDFKTYMFWAQNSTVSNTKSNVRNLFSEQKHFWNKVKKYIDEYYSVWDDLIAAWLTAKIDLPVRLATFNDLAKIVIKWEKLTNKINKASKAAEKVAKAWEKVKTWEQVAKDIEKATSTTNKIKESIKYPFKKWKESRENSKKISEATNKAKDDLSFWTKNKLWFSNAARWIAEEVITSAAFQWMTPYDYTAADAIMDIWWALFSGWMRWKKFNNALWLLKLQSNDAAWVTWWLRDVNKLSKVDTEEVLTKLNQQSIKDLSDSIKEQLGFINDEIKEVSRTQFRTKARDLSETARKIIDWWDWKGGLLQKLIDEYEADLMYNFYNSVEKSINNLVKKNKDWSLSWNQWKLSNKEFARRKELARQKLYAWETLDNVSTVWWVVKWINAIKNDVKKNITMYVWRSGKKNAKWEPMAVKWSDGKWKWNETTEKDERKKEIEKKTRNRLRRYWLDRSKAIWKERFWWFWWYKNELSSPLWEFWQMLNIYINNFIYAKKVSKQDAVNGLSILWAWAKETFTKWLEETHENKTLEDMSMRELIRAIQDFWKAWDNILWPDWRLSKRISNKDPVSKSKRWIANNTYEDAKKMNPELEFMWQNLFDEIAKDDTLTILEKETKLSSWKHTYKEWDEIINLAIKWDNSWEVWKWSTLVGIDLPIRKEWASKDSTLDSAYEDIPSRAVFNDTYEEKAIFWEKWTLYLKWHEWEWAERVANIKPNKFLRNGSQEFTYEWKWKYKDWTRYYYVYDDNKVRVWTIVTFPHTDWAGDASIRDVSVKFVDRIVEWDWCIDFEVVKSEDITTYPREMNMTPREDTPVITRYDADEWFKKTETTLKQWHEFSVFVRNRNTSYKWFKKLIPWYTDRVPESVFNTIIRDSKLWVVDKQNMLMSFMFNKKIDVTNQWIKLDLKGWNTFKMDWYKRVENRYNSKWKFLRTDEYNIPWDADEFMKSRQKGYVLLTKDDGTTEAFMYDKWVNNWQYNLYKSIDQQNPSGVISLTSKNSKAFIIDWKKRIYVPTIEFLDTVDNIEDANRIIWDRFWELKVEVKVPDWDDMYKEIYERIKWKPITKEEYHQLRSTPNMTPQRYLNNEIDKFRRSRFWKYFIIKWGDWESVINQMAWYEKRVKLAETYVKQFDGATDLTDSEIIVAVNRIFKKKASMKTKLSPWEAEIRDILYWEWKTNIGDIDLINIYWYSMFWKEPHRIESPRIKRLRARRDRILLGIYKDPMILGLSDWEKESLINIRLRKKINNLSEEDLIKDIKEHPEEYRAISEALAKRFAKYDSNNLNKPLEKRHWEAMARIKEIEQEIEKWRWKRKAWPNTKWIQKEITNYQKWAVDNLVVEAEDEFNNAVASWDEVAIDAAASKYNELVEYERRFAEEQEYKNDVTKWYTSDQFDELAKQVVSGKQINQPLTQQEVTERLNDLTWNRIKWLRIIEVDPRTWTVTTKWFSHAEQIKYKQQIKASAQHVLNWEANAAHVRELHAIVIDPTRALSTTIGHEWFHEAVYLLQDSKWKPKRIEWLYADTYKKHSKEINQFAESRGYDDAYSELRASDEDAYIKQITEEWLAERFWEYVNNRLTHIDTELEIFFKELWNKIKLIFSDTDALELFEDIYEWRVTYWDIDITINPRDSSTVNFSLLSSEAKQFFDDFDPNKNSLRFWDSYSDSITSILKMNWLEDKDLKILATRGYSWRWAALWEIKMPLSDWRRVSFNELLESTCKSDAVRVADDLTEYIYWRQMASDFLPLKDENLLALRDNWKISYGMNWYEVSFSSDPFYPMFQSVWVYKVDQDTGKIIENSLKPFQFNITVWNKTIMSFDQEKLKKVILNYINKNNVPMIMQWIDWYNMVMEIIFKKLNDSEATQLSRAELNANLIKHIQSYDTTKVNASTDIKNTLLAQDLCDTLEYWVRNWYDQLESAELKWVDQWLKNFAKEAFYVYLFNQYIPHWLSKWFVERALFERKMQLTANLVEEADRLWINWEITNPDKWRRLIHFIINFWDGLDRRIWWHVPDNSNSSIIDSFNRRGIDITNHIINSDPWIYLWKQSIVSTRAEDYRKALANRKNNFCYIWQNMRNKLEKERKYMFDDSRLSFQKVPAIINWKKIVVDASWMKSLSEDEILGKYKKWDYQPVTIISNARHIENVKYMNDIYKKYDISIEKASPEIKETLNKLKKDRRWAVKTTRENTRRRIYNREEYNRLQDEVERLRKEMAFNNKRWEEIQQWEIYAEINRIKNVLDADSDALKAVKNADPNTAVKSSDSKPKEIKLATKNVETDWYQAPFWTLAWFDPEWLSESTIDSMKNIKKYQSEYKATWQYKDELDALEWMDNKYIIYYVKEWEVEDDMLFNIITQNDYVTIWAENSKTLNEWELWLSGNGDYERVASREWSNINYYRKKDLENNTEKTTKELSSEEDNYTEKDKEAVYWSVNDSSMTC